MALRRILKMDRHEAALRRKSKPVTQFDQKLAKLLDDLLETLHHTED